jgi:hypothetical protein
MIKKRLLVPIFLILSLSLVLAADYNMQISTSKNIFGAGENIILKVTLLDSQNNPVNDNVLVTLEDAEKRIKIEKEIIANEFVEIKIPEGASYGPGKITAKYQNLESTGSFTIEISELAKFEIKENTLIITNIGNTKYTKTVQITIGETTGIKEPKLDVGKSVSYKLVAPEGVYNIKVTDGDPKTTISQGNVHLSGTGNVVGAIDETASERSPLTGTIRPDTNQDQNILSYVKSNGKFVYTFIVVIFGAMILLAIERRYRKKL